MAEAARFEQAFVPSTGSRGWSPLHCLYATPPSQCARRDSNSHRACFKDAASACLGYARRAMRAAGVEPAPRLFLREPPLPFGSRALLSTDTGGEIRTHKSRLLRTVCLPVAPLPRAMLEEGLEPSRGFEARGDLSAVRLPITPHQPNPSKTPGEGVEPP